MLGGIGTLLSTPPHFFPPVRKLSFRQKRNIYTGIKTFRLEKSYLLLLKEKYYLCKEEIWKERLRFFRVEMKSKLVNGG